MKWDSIDRRYEDERGRAVSPATIRKYITEYIESEKAVVERQAARLFSQSITVQDFFVFMRSRISAWHGIAGVIAYGGEDQMDRERWARVNQRILSELAYLADFENAAIESFTAVERIATSTARSLPSAGELLPDTQAAVRQSVSRALLTAAPSEAQALTRRALIEVVESITPETASAIAQNAVRGADLLIGGTIEPRAQMYTEAIWASHENNVLARESDEGVTMGRRVLEDGDSCDDCIAWASDEFRPIDELEEIGASVCGSRCRCEFEFDVKGVQFAVSELFGGTIRGQDRYGGDVDLN